MKKNLLAMVIVGVVMLSLVSCSNKDKDKDKISDGDKPGVSTNEEPKEAENEGEAKKEYKALTTKEAIEFNKNTIGEMSKLFNDKGFIAIQKVSTNDKSLAEGPSILQYSKESGEKPYYSAIAYGATIKEKVVGISYQFNYFVDGQKLKSGEHAIPKSRELLIVEPYKIMTGKDISNEVLDRIDKLIKETYVEGLINDETLLVTEGAFKVNLSLSTGEISFNITSSGNGN